MLIVLQFPFADLRAFGDADDDTRVPIATSFSQSDLLGTRDFGGTRRPPFLNCVGPLRKRRQGVRYGGESLYFNGRRALRFTDRFRSVPDPRGGTPITVDLFFRRFQAFRDDHQLAKYELALLLDLTKRDALDAASLRTLLDSCLTLPVIVPPLTAPVPLISAGRHLASSLLRHTTCRRQATPPEWTMACGAPSLVVEYGTSEIAELSRGSRVVALEESQRIRLAAAGATIGGLPVTMWFLSTGETAITLEWFDRDEIADARELTRQLRINLLRHHAEREALTYTLQRVRDHDLSVLGPDLAHSALRTYLVRSSARLTREHRFGLAQAPITTGIAEVEAAAGFVDRRDMSRYTEAWEQLAQVLDGELFAKLAGALRRLPMGTAEETADLRTLLRQGQRPPRKLAVSYAHEDDRLMKSFGAHLDVAVQDGMVAPWDDRWIPAGSDWKAEIDRRFLEADIVVPLLSPDFLASRFCMEVEMPMVFERAARGEVALVPVVVRACEWQHTMFGKVQGVPMDEMPLVARGSRTAAWRIVIHRVLTARTGSVLTSA